MEPKKSLEKLINITNTEIKGKYQNKAVLGGLDKFPSQWEKEAQSDQIPDLYILKISELLRNYIILDPVSRENSVNEIRQIIHQILAIPEYESSNLYPDNIKDYKITHGVIPMKSKEGDLKGLNHSSRVSTTENALNSPITVMKGIGPLNSKKFEAIGIRTVYDLLYYFPRRYDDFSQLKTINRLVLNEEVTVIAKIYKAEFVPPMGKKKGRIEALVTDGTGFLRVNWYPGKYANFFLKKLRINMSIVLSGNIETFLGRLVMNNPEWEPLEKDHLNTNRIVPVYPLTAGISQRNIRNLTFQSVRYWSPKLSDFIPQSVKLEAKLIDLGVAIQQVHFPETEDYLKQAQFRLAFDEIFLLQLGVLKQRSQWKSKPAEIIPSSDEWLQKIINYLPFKLTNAQNRVLEDVRKDLIIGKPMNRLIQGDVGSGKTIIAAITAMIVNNHGGQCAIMAPTSILAEQHHRTFRNLLIGKNNSGENSYSEKEIRLLIGATSEAEKEEIRAGILNGSIKILIGTHALIESPVQFNNLQFIVIDEQHRFGVSQRSGLRSKGTNPHLMVMTATPIPRSLALTLYGDLDLSVMDEMPAGRQPVKTQIINPIQREKAYSLIREQIERGHQAFIIFPLVELGERDEGKAAVEEHERLQKHIFTLNRVGLLHGRMKSEDKEKVMSDFHQAKYDILVSTSVVEVGVDVPNATVMMIEGANRFGLAQLHQFRGRVGRGRANSYCLLIPENEDAMENERLKVMVETTDGFILAEKDLEQRGPGEFLGNRQSGFVELKMAKLTDIKIIEIARQQGVKLFNKDPNLSLPENQELNVQLNKFWEASKGEVS